MIFWEDINIQLNSGKTLKYVSHVSIYGGILKTHHRITWLKQKTALVLNDFTGEFQGKIPLWIILP